MGCIDLLWRFGWDGMGGGHVRFAYLYYLLRSRFPFSTRFVSFYFYSTCIPLLEVATNPRFSWRGIAAD